MQLIYIRNFPVQKETTRNFSLHFIFIIFKQAQGSVDENVMLFRLHVRIHNTSVISRDFFLMGRSWFVCLNASKF